MLQEALQTKNIDDFYECGETIARGGQGVVLHAARKEDDKAVVVKYYHDRDEFSLTDEDQAEVGFRRERNFLTLANEAGVKGVPTLLDVGLSPGIRQPWAVFEPIKSRTLKQIVDEEGFIPTQDFLTKLVNEVSDVLTYAHNGNVQTITHRDLQPENIFADEDIIVGDWATSKAITGNTDMRTQFFTQYFTAPEVIEGEKFEFKEFADHRSDVYSLGRIMQYTMLGNDSFNAAEGMPNSGDFRFTNVNLRTIRVLEKATKRNPNERYGTIEEFRESYLESLKEKSVEVVERGINPYTVKLIGAVENTDKKSAGSEVEKETESIKLSTIVEKTHMTWPTNKRQQWKFDFEIAKRVMQLNRHELVADGFGNADPFDEISGPGGDLEYLRAQAFLYNIEMHKKNDPLLRRLVDEGVSMVDQVKETIELNSMNRWEWFRNLKARIKNGETTLGHSKREHNTWITTFFSEGDNALHDLKFKKDLPSSLRKRMTYGAVVDQITMLGTYAVGSYFLKSGLNSNEILTGIGISTAWGYLSGIRYGLKRSKSKLLEQAKEFDAMYERAVLIDRLGYEPFDVEGVKIYYHEQSYGDPTHYIVETKKSRNDNDGSELNRSVFNLRVANAGMREKIALGEVNKAGIPPLLLPDNRKYFQRTSKSDDLEKIKEVAEAHGVQMTKLTYGGMLEIERKIRDGKHRNRWYHNLIDRII